MEGTKPHAIVNAANFIPYLQLISPEASSSVKCAFIKSMKRMFTHVAVAPDNEAQRSIVSATCFDLIEDPDFEVRMQFRSVIETCKLN